MAYCLLLCGVPILSTRANYEVLSRFERENGGPGGDFEADKCLLIITLRTLIITIDHKNIENRIVSGCKQTINDLKTDTFFNRLYKVGAINEDKWYLQNP